MPTGFLQLAQTISIASPRSTCIRRPHHTHSRPHFQPPQQPVAGVFPREGLLRLAQIFLQQSLVFFTLEIRPDFPNHLYDLFDCHA
jgi:hypothetical protein